jgi:hypothetical protein
MIAVGHGAGDLPLSSAVQKRRRHTRAMFVSTVVMLAVAGCAAPDGRPELGGSALVDTYRASAGEPVTSFRIDNGVNSWANLGPQHLAVFTGSNEAYFLELATRCPDLESAVRISLTGENQRVEAGFDGVIVRSAVTTVTPSLCPIARIRPLDLEALDARQSERTQIDAVRREAVP